MRLTAFRRQSAKEQTPLAPRARDALLGSLDILQLSTMREYQTSEKTQKRDHETDRQIFVRGQEDLMGVTDVIDD